MRQPYAYDANESTRQLVEDGMSTKLTNTHTVCGFSVVSRVRSKTMHSRLLRFEIFSALELSRTALLGCRLAASRLREAACWQLQWGRLLLLIGAKTNHYGTWYWIYWHCGYSLCDSLSQSWDTGLSVALFISVVITSSTKSTVSFTTPWTW